MNIRIAVVVIFFTNPLTYQPLFASETCDTVTEEKISQFVETHRSNWNNLLVSKLFLPSPPAGESVKFEKGLPLQIYTITPESLRNYATQGYFKSTLIPEGIWYVPISSAYTYDFLEIHCSNGELGISGIAGSLISKQFNEIYGKLKEQIDFGETKNLIVKIDATKRLFLALEKSNAVTIYPLIAFPDQYISLKAVNNLGGYSASDVLLLVAIEFLTTANMVTVTSELKIVIPKAAYMPPTASGATDMLWINMEYLPNVENRLLFEVTDYCVLPYI